MLLLLHSRTMDDAAIVWKLKLTIPKMTGFTHGFLDTKHLILIHSWLTSHVSQLHKFPKQLIICSWIRDKTGWHLTCLDLLVHAPKSFLQYMPLFSCLANSYRRIQIPPGAPTSPGYWCVTWKGQSGWAAWPLVFWPRLDSWLIWSWESCWKRAICRLVSLTPCNMCHVG